MRPPALALLFLGFGLILGTATGYWLGATDPSGPRAIGFDGASPQGSQNREDVRGTDDELARTTSDVGVVPSGSDTRRTEREARLVADRALRGERASVEDHVAGTGVISGQVTDPQGAPIEGATIVSQPRIGRAGAPDVQDSSRIGRAWSGFGSIDESVAQNARWRLERRAGSAVTESDANGRFQLDELIEGEHVVDAFAEGFEFDTNLVRVGTEVRIVGHAVSEFAIDVVLPSGERAESAKIAIEDERGEQELFAWSADAPVLRHQARSLRLRALRGDVMSVQYRRHIAKLHSDVRVIDLDRDGDGPHVFQLRPMDLLRIEVIDESTIVPRLHSRLKVVGSAGEVAFASSATDENVHIVRDVAPGSYEVQVYRGVDREPLVSRTVDVVPGTNDVEIVLGDVDLSRYLIATCRDERGRPVEGVTFLYHRRVGHRESPSGVSDLERPLGEYWIDIDEFCRARDVSVGERVVLTALSPDRGLVRKEVDVGPGEALFVIPAPARLTVEVSGPSTDLVMIEVFSADARGGHRVSSMKRPLPVRDGRVGPVRTQAGHAWIEAILASDGNRQGGPIATKLVKIGAGEQTASITVPELYDLIVRVPESTSDTRLQLDGPIGSDRARRSRFFGRADESGRWIQEKLLAGTYDLWRYEGNGRERMTIEVPSSEVTFQAVTPTGFVVTAVREDTYAAKNGLRVGDVLKAIGGHEVDGEAWWSLFVTEIQQGEADLIVRRQGSSVTLELSRFSGQRVTLGDLGLTVRPVD